ncbi:MAG: prolipoprotein diacylglyceryl transferase [Rhodothermales bacterium]|nr:prolipoprotein diacylglyceryl transferase [Rhodothermales bacterium]
MNEAVRVRHEAAHRAYAGLEPEGIPHPPHPIAHYERRDARRLDGISRALDRLARPFMRFGGRRISSYNGMGYIGIVAGTAAGAAVGAVRGLSPGVLAAVWLAVVLVSAAQIVATVVVTGRDRLVFLRFLLGGLVASALVAGLAGVSVLAVLDAVIVGFGALQAPGRVGCFMAGCCHGVPAAWGVSYGARHTASGIPPALFGVRFVPIQLLESGWIVLCTFVAIVLAFSGAAAGVPLFVYIAFYATGRFSVEYARGDRYRLAHGGLTEAQWITLALTLGASGAVLAGGAPAPRWLPGVLALPILFALWQAMRRRRDGGATEPHDLFLLARAIDTLEAGDAMPARRPGAVHVARMTNGVLVSREPAVDGISLTFTLSGTAGLLAPRKARRLGAFLFRLRPAIQQAVLYKAGANMYHMACRLTRSVDAPAPTPFLA